MDERRYDILALDIDGTLLTSGKSLRERDVLAVRAAAARGVRVVLATARPPRSTRPIVEALGLFEASATSAAVRAERVEAGPAVTINYNGALTWGHAESRRGAPMEHLPLDPETQQKAVRAARQVDPRVMVWIEILDKWYTDNATPDFGVEHAHETEGMLIGTETSKAHPPDFIGPLAAFLHVPATKVMFLGPPSRLRPVFAEVESRFAKRGLLACKVSDAHLFSVCHASADKGLALRSLAHRLGVPRERVLAMGDAPNDVGMLRWAGKGVAVANAWDEAKAAASEVAPETNDECAVAGVLGREGLV